MSSTLSERNDRLKIPGRLFKTVDISATDDDFGDIQVKLYCNKAGAATVKVDLAGGGTFTFVVAGPCWLDARVTKVYKIGTTLTGAGEIGAFVGE